MHSIFKSIDNSSRSIKHLNTSEVIDIIQNHPQSDLIIKALHDPVEGGKYNEIKEHKDRVYSHVNKDFEFVARNLYSHVKFSMLPIVTWAAKVNKKRRLLDIQDNDLSGYIYFDIDEFTDLIEHDNLNSIEDAKDRAWSLITNDGYPFIKAAWRSLSGGGFGFLVKVKGINKSNFKSTWGAINAIFEAKGLTLDKQTKDLTRCNVLPYDPNIFIREDNKVKAFYAVKPPKRKKASIGFALPTDVEQDVLHYYLQSALRNEKNWKEGRLRHQFYFSYFIFCNYKGINLHNSFKFLENGSKTNEAIFSGKYDHSYCYNLMEYIKKQYTSDFATNKIEFNSGGSKVTEKNIYEGNIEYKLDYLWFSINKSHEIGKAISLFAKKAKYAGIIKVDTIDYVAKTINANSCINIVHSIYRNSKYGFGVVKKYTTEELKEKRENYIQWCKERNFDVTIRKAYPHKSFGRLEKELNKQLKFNQLEINNVTNIFAPIIKMAKKLAITQGDVKDFLYDNYTIDSKKWKNLIKTVGKEAANNKHLLFCEIVERGKFLIREIYNENPWTYGINITKRLNVEDVKKWHNIKKTFNIKKGKQFISDLNLTVEESFVLWGDTSMGKTTWICEKVKGKRILLVPITSLLEGAYNKYESSVYYNDIKNVKEGDELIICTYSSFQNLLKEIKRDWTDFNPSDYTIYFDEEHNNAVSASKNYRNKELNFIADNYQLFKHIVYMTGTKMPILHPKLINLPIYRVKWEETPVKVARRIRYEGSNIDAAIESNLDRDGKNIIYLQNKQMDGQLGRLMTYLKMKNWDEKNIWVINSSTKNTTAYKNLIENERIDDHVQILICTSVVVEGVNINNDDITTIHFATNEGIATSEQLVNRARNVFRTDGTDCMINLYAPVSVDIFEEEHHINIYEMQEDMIKKAKANLRLFSDYYNGGSESSKVSMRIFSQQIFSNSSMFRPIDGRWEVDYLAIANTVYEAEKNFAYRNYGYFKMMLKEYNWNFLDDVFVTAKKSKEESDTINAFVEEQKEEIQLYLNNMLQEIDEEGLEETIQLSETKNPDVFNDKKYPNLEKDIRFKVRILARNMSFDDALSLISKWINEYNRTKEKWNIILRKLNIKVAQKLSIFQKKKNLNSPGAKNLIIYYKKKLKHEDKTGKKSLLTAYNLKQIVNSSLKVEVDEVEALSILKQYFTVDEILIKNKVKYYLSGLIIGNDLATFNSELEKWANGVVKNERKLTNDQLLLEINNILDDLPIMSNFKVPNTNKAMRLINDHYQFEKVSEVTKGKKKKKAVYTITSLKSKEFDGIKITTLDDIPLLEKHIDDMSSSELDTFTKHNNLLAQAYHFDTMEDYNLILT